LLMHPSVAQVCVVGIADDTWGQRIVAAVVLRSDQSASEEELRDLVREHLRGSKTPERIIFRTELPHTETGKMLRRLVQQELTESL
jgi:acyl-coenzyme A synthetase/AMP-(fatty) acid ligase